MKDEEMRDEKDGNDERIRVLCCVVAFVFESDLSSSVQYFDFSLPLERALPPSKTNRP